MLSLVNVKAIEGPTSCSAGTKTADYKRRKRVNGQSDEHHCRTLWWFAQRSFLKGRGLSVERRGVCSQTDVPAKNGKTIARNLQKPSGEEKNWPCEIGSRLDCLPGNSGGGNSC